MRGVEYAGVGGSLQDILNIQEEMGHCQRLECWRRWGILSGVEYSGGSGTLREMWNMQHRMGHCDRCVIGGRRWDIAGHVDYAGRGGTCERCGICRSRWDIARQVEYAGGGGTLPEMWNMLGDIARDVEYAGGGGTFLAVWDIQEGVGHYERCGICSKIWDIAIGVE